MGEIDADIVAEMGTANSNFGSDSKDIQDDKDRAYAKAEKILKVCVDYHQGLVDDAKADMDNKCDVVLPAAATARDKAQTEFDNALKLLEEAKETRKLTIQTCTATRDAALIQADKFYAERATSIQSDHAAEETRLQTTIAQSDEIVKLVGNMTFTASTLLQAKTEGDVSKSYRTVDSGDEKTKIVGLIESLQTQVANERSRSAAEFLADNANNEAEKARADDEAAAVAKADIDSLQAAVDTARDAKTAAEPELAAATQAHQEASDIHNANMDTRATAQKIQTTNTPNFQKDLEQTQAVADKILAKQEELHLKCKLSEKYLEITQGYVTLIQTAASSVSTSALGTTVNSAVSVDDSYTAADTVGMITNAHQSIKAQLKKETKAERARCRLEGVDNPGCHKSEAGTEAWDHDTHVDVDNHADTAGMGQNQQYDANGEVASRRLPSAQTLGSVVSTILSQIDAEQTRVGIECAKQEATFNGQKIDTYAVAQGHYDAQMKEDADRLAAAQLAEAASAAVLATALARKQIAQSDYDEKAATLRDALATQEKYVPIVNKQKADSLATNIDRFNAASTAINDSKKSGDAKYDEQDALLAEVKTQVEAGLNKVELLQSLTTVVKKIVKTRLYDFSAGKSKQFADQAAGNYHDNGQGGFNSTEYSGDTDTLTGMINSLIAQNNQQLDVVKTTSGTHIAAEEKGRDARINAADATLQAELDRLQTDANFAHGELVAAQAAEDAQEIVKDAAIADRVLKEDIYYQTLEEGNNRKSVALEKRIACVTNANAAYTSETAAYAQSLKSQGELLDYELQVVAQMRKAMNGEEFGAAPEMKTFDHCTNEKTAADAAATECNAAKSACEHSKIDTLNDGSTQTGRRLLASPCDQETTSCDAKDSARATYESCLGQAQLLSTEELKAAFVQLHSKYASETDMSDTFSEHKDDMESILLAVEAKIAQGRSAAKDQHDADVASSLAKQTQDVAGCIAAEKAVIDKWDSKIAVAKAAWDAAAVVEATEVAEYLRLVGIKNNMQSLYDAAVNRQQTEGSLARKLHKEDVDGAWEYYTDMHQGITSVATSDYEYLTEELESLQTVLDIVDQLNLDGDTNGEQVAAEHVTNDYATDAAQAKAAYHGATINESNSQGRAGEGVNPTR